MRLEDCFICGKRDTNCKRIDNHEWCHQCLFQFNNLFKPYEPPKRVLTEKRLRELFIYNPWSGDFIRKKSTSNNVKAWSIANSTDKSKGYIRFSIDNRLYYAHRLAWLYMTGSWPKDQIVHLNGDRGDNRWENLKAKDL